MVKLPFNFIRDKFLLVWLQILVNNPICLALYQTDIQCPRMILERKKNERGEKEKERD